MYDGLLDAEEGLKWNFKERYVNFCKKIHFLYSFDHVSNQEFNSTLIRNVQGVVKDEYDTTMIKHKCL